MLHRKVFAVDPMAALHEGAGRFVIDGGQGADVADELIQQGGLDQVCLLGDQGLLRQHHLLGGDGVGRQQPPVDVAAVAQVRVVGVLQEEERRSAGFLELKRHPSVNKINIFRSHLRRQAEDLLHQLLGL